MRSQKLLFDHMAVRVGAYLLIRICPFTSCCGGSPISLLNSLSAVASESASLLSWLPPGMPHFPAPCFTFLISSTFPESLHMRRNLLGNSSTSATMTPGVGVQGF